MFTNYLKITLRNLRRNKVYSLINITGLSAGTAVAIAIGVSVPRPQMLWSGAATSKIESATRTSERTNRVTVNRCLKTCLQRFVLARPGAA